MSKPLRLAAVLAAAALSLAAPMLAAAKPAAARAPAAPTQLDRFLRHLHTLRVSFRQTLVGAHGGVISRSAGTLIVDRPGKFRWQSRPLGANGAPTGAGQLMVGDGRNVGFYDRDLQQVTVQPVTAALSATPAMLLSGTVDVHRHFRERPAGRREGLSWVFVEPRNASAADFRRALFGFRHGTLERMILDDTLGQIATVVFTHIEVNVPVSAKLLTFTAPPGVDVIGTPAK